jgi:transcription elongation factor GreA
MTERFPITPEGFSKLREKLKHLDEEVRPEVEKRLGVAREMGDLSENAEYDSAREELWRLDKQISDLRNYMARSEIIDPSKKRTDEVSFGSKIKIRDLKNKEVIEYTLVGEKESNPSDGFISVSSPVGQGLVGHKIGEKIDIKVPAGVLHYEIISIE